MLYRKKKSIDYGHNVKRQLNQTNTNTESAQKSNLINAYM